jgi:uncharacterized protein with von Willebrand factor type A (vWA) domain
VCPSPRTPGSRSSRRSQRASTSDTLDGFYQVARCILIQSEAHYDDFDRVFAESFRGVAADARELLSQLEEWLRDPKLLEFLDPELRAQLKAMDLEELRRELLDRLEKQKERHDGGNHWVGTGGTSPFGTGGAHPTGVRVGGGGSRSALAVADARRFREFRRDLVLDTRQIAAPSVASVASPATRASWSSTSTRPSTPPPATAGDIEVVLTPERHADVRLLLLLDVGGSMDPHAQLVSRLFSAAHQGGGFKELRSYYFHNCVYQRVFEDAPSTSRSAPPSCSRPSTPSGPSCSSATRTCTPAS